MLHLWDMITLLLHKRDLQAWFTLHKENLKAIIHEGVKT